MRRLTILALAVVAMASCAKEESTYIDDSSNVVKFTSGAISRVTSDGKDYWEKGDDINIIAIESSVTKYSNVVYVSDIEEDSAQTTGFKFSSGTEIVFPNVASGTMTFYACYPYTTYQQISNYEGNPSYGYFVSIANQAGDYDYGNVDFMTANETKSYGSGVTDKNVDFEFSHKLAKVVITVDKNDNLLSLAGLEASVKNIYKERYYSLEGVLYADVNSTTTDTAIDLTVSNNTVTAILHPMSVGNCSSAEFIFSVTEGSKSFTVPFDVTLQAGYIHYYTVDLGNDYPVFKSGSAIEDWNEDKDDEGNVIAPTELIPEE